MKNPLLFLVLSAAPLLAIDNLAPLAAWDELAPGVWRARVGNVEGELAYTALAAREPRLDVLRALPQVPFPFTAKPVETHQSAERLIQVRIPASPDESIYGFGLQLDSIRHNKRVLQLNVDHWAEGGGRTHAPVPFFISSRGYGVFFNTARFLKVYVLVGNRKASPDNPLPVDRNPPPEEPAPREWNALPDSDAIEAVVHADGLEILVFAGTDLQDIVARYNLYCGGGSLPPLWGLGFWHRVPAAFTAGETLAEVQEFADRGIPLDVIGLEPGWMTRSYPCTFEWQPHRFPDPAGFTRRMLDLGVRLNLWINPYVSPEAEIYPKLDPYAGSHTVWLGIVPDFTIPEAREILREQFARDHVGIGISGFKVDEVDGYDRWLWPEHASFPSGTPAEAMRQVYGLLLQEVLYKELYHRANLRTFGNVRASNGGASGYPFVIYSDSYDHGEYITGISAASLGGILWTPEVRQGRSAEEWRARIQTVCLSPMAQLNAWSSATKPWDFESVADDVREAILLRMRLLPYLYTAFADYNRRGIPPFRAMILEAGNRLPVEDAVPSWVDDVADPYALGRETGRVDQYMCGPSILVAPYHGDQMQQRVVDLPVGDWYDFYTGDFAGNGETITVSSPGRIPLFVKDGAVIPLLAKPVERTRDAYGCPLEVRHYGQAAGSFELYEDDGISFDYEEGAYSLRRFVFQDGGGGEEFLKQGPRMFGEVISWVDMTN